MQVGLPDRHGLHIYCLAYFHIQTTKPTPIRPIPTATQQPQLQHRIISSCCCCCRRCHCSIGAVVLNTSTATPPSTDLLCSDAAQSTSHQGMFTRVVQQACLFCVCNRERRQVLVAVQPHFKGFMYEPNENSVTSPRRPFPGSPPDCLSAYLFSHSLKAIMQYPTSTSSEASLAPKEQSETAVALSSGHWWPSGAASSRTPAALRSGKGLGFFSFAAVSIWKLPPPPPQCEGSRMLDFLFPRRSSPRARAELEPYTAEKTLG